MQALMFYQKRGYTLAKLYVNAVEKARKIKPEIPFAADNGIPTRDEILLVKDLTSSVFRFAREKPYGSNAATPLKC